MEIIIDPVLNGFNQEAPHITKKYDKQMSGIPVRFLNGLGDDADISGRLVSPRVKAAAAEAVQAANRAKIARANYERAVQMQGLGAFNISLPNLKEIADDAARIAREKAEAAKRLLNEKVIDPIKEAIQESKDYDAATNAKHLFNAAPFTPAREALKQVVKHNVFGAGSIIDYVRRTNPSKWSEIKKIWYTFGGDPGNLDPFLNEGSNKEPRAVAPAILNKFKAIDGMLEKANRIYKDKTGKVPTGIPPFDDGSAIINVPDPVVTVLPSNYVPGGSVVVNDAASGKPTGPVSPVPGGVLKSGNNFIPGGAVVIPSGNLQVNPGTVYTLNGFGEVVTAGAGSAATPVAAGTVATSIPLWVQVAGAIGGLLATVTPLYVASKGFDPNLNHGNNGGTPYIPGGTPVNNDPTGGGGTNLDPHGDLPPDPSGNTTKKASSQTLLIGLGVVGLGLVTAYALTAGSRKKARGLSGTGRTKRAPRKARTGRIVIK